MTADFLVIGQGITGSWISYLLYKSQVSFLVVDKTTYPNASTVASGIINPVTGRRYVKSWMAEKLIHFTDIHYKLMEEETGVKTYRKIPILKVLHSNRDVNEWSSKADTDYYDPFLKSQEIVRLDESSFDFTNGLFEIQGGSIINTNLFLTSWRKFLIGKGLLIEDHILPSQIIFNKGSIQWKNIKAARMILCEGYNAIRNPYSNFLPLTYTKGECFIIKCPRLNLRSIISGNVSIVPLETKDYYYIGSTNQRDDPSLHPTSKMFHRLKKFLEECLRLPYQIVAHYTGVRPTTKDRRPLIGVHPEIKNLVIFNGMGTKGFSLAPYFANQLADHLLHGKDLQKEVDLRRVAYGKG